MNIWVNGCFDILHTGHLDLLEYAKNLRISPYFKKGDKNYLYVGIDSDERVKQLKGLSRPIVNEEDRKRIIQSLKCVDKVVIFNTDDELRENIFYYNIDIMVIGDHYKDKTVIGSENSKNGVFFFKTDERSTTNIIEKIKNL